MARELAGLSIRLALAVLLFGCAKTAAKPHELPASDPYVQALYAKMNYAACRLVRHPQPDAAERKRLDAAISQFEDEMARAEANAEAFGYRDYIELGRLSFTRRLSSELHVGCYPNEIEAARHAHSALERFRIHMIERGRLLRR